MSWANLQVNGQILLNYGQIVVKVVKVWSNLVGYDQDRVAGPLKLDNDGF
jgi:hypothetical protein